MVEATSVFAMLDPLGDWSNIGRPLPVTWSLIGESVAQRKTPMLDLEPADTEGVRSWGKDLVMARPGGSREV